MLRRAEQFIFVLFVCIFTKRAFCFLIFTLALFSNTVLKYVVKMYCKHVINIIITNDESKSRRKTIRNKPFFFILTK